MANVRQSLSLVIGISALGCFGGTEPEIVAVEQNDLGITGIEVAHQRQQDERVLVVRGLDDDGNELASASLRTGWVTYSSYPGLVPPELSMGTELTLTVGDKTLPLVTPNVNPHATPLPTFMPTLAAFVSLAPVANEIVKEAGIRFESPPAPANPDGEVAYTAHNCYASLFPSTETVTSCCQDDNWTFHTNGNNLLVRSYWGSGTYPPPCRDNYNNTGCGWWDNVFYGRCDFGPCGGHLYASGGNSNSTVFVPNSQPTWCGIDGDGWGGSGGGDPEEYSGQDTYPGLTAACYATMCCANGTPTNNPQGDCNTTSCTGDGGGCGGDSECCSGFCYGGTCWLLP